MTDSKTCDICVERINKINTLITCISCDLQCCKTCFKRYITEPSHYFQCMGCKIEFDRSSLHKRLGSTFMKNEFKLIRERMLFEHEKSLLPATQLILEKEFEIEKLEEENLNLNKKFNSLRISRRNQLTEFCNKTETKTIKETIDRYVSMVEEVNNVDSLIEEESKQIKKKIREMRDSTSKPKITFIRKCPKTDCNGMLSAENRTSNNNYCCTVCKSISCKECRELCGKEHDHECNSETLETIKFIDESSKPCPSCASPIYKITGCNQMWCTSCNTAFDWRTLKISTGNVHNPHYFEYMRQQGHQDRNPLDIRCGQEITNHSILYLDKLLKEYLNKLFINSTTTKPAYTDRKKKLDDIVEYLRVAIHHNSNSIRKMQATNTFVQNQSLRLLLLKGFITETDFKTKIQRTDKAESKKRDLLNILITYRDCCISIYFRFLDDVEKHKLTLKAFDDYYKEFNTLIKYVDTCLSETADVYQSRSSYSGILDM